jgi:hypothetical protein
MAVLLKVSPLQQLIPRLANRYGLGRPCTLQSDNLDVHMVNEL